MHDRHERVGELVLAALELPPERRGVFLDEACAGDADLRAEVQKLIAADGETSNFAEPAATASLVPRFPPGKELAGRFRVVRFIAAGGMGDVYEVQDLELGERVALKTVRPEVVGNPHSLSRFKREIQYAKHVTHPNVCRIHDLGSHREGAVEIAFLTMEFLDGETLSARLRSVGRMTTEEALPLVTQMAEALSAAHDAGIIHRDFKTSNVMLVGSGAAQRAVVTDFGLAHSSSPAGDHSLTEAGKLVGTPAYMAPEQVMHGALTPVTDIYALGLVIYEMVTGHRPFRGTTPIGSALKRLTEPPMSPVVYAPNLNARWVSVILRCLEREPARRFQTSREVVRALTDPGSDAPTQSLTQERAFSFSRRSWATICLAVFVVAPIGFLGWRSWRQTSRPPTGDALRWYQEGINAIRDGTYFKASKALERAVAMAPNYPLAHARLAEAWMELDYTDKAQEQMLEANPPGTQRKLPGSEELYLQATHLTLTNDFTGAIAKYQEVLKQASEASKADAYFDLGRAYERNQKTTEAIQSYEEVIRRSPQYAGAFLRLGALYARAQSAAKAAAAFDQAASLYRSLSNIEGVTEVLYQRANAAYSTGHPNEANSLAEQAVTMARTAGNVSQEIGALLRQASSQYALGDSVRGQQYATRALELARANGLENLTTRGLTQLSNAALNRGDLDDAKSYCSQAIEYARRHKSLANEMRATLTLASVLIQQGDVNEGVPYLERVIAFYQQGGYRKQTGQWYILMSRARRGQGDYESALKASEEAFEIARQTGDRSLEAFADGSTGDTLAQQQRCRESLAYYERYHAAAQAIGDMAGIGYALLGIGQQLNYLGHYKEAGVDLEKALAIANQPGGDKSLKAQVHLAFAASFLSRLRFSEAGAEARKALEADSQDIDLMLHAHSILALSMTGSGNKEALDHADEAIRLAEKLRAPTGIADALLTAAEVRLERGDAGSAYDSALRAQQTFVRFLQIESEWRARLVMSRAAAAKGDRPATRNSASQASEALERLSRLWSAEDYASYLARPDIRRLKAQLMVLLQ